MLGSPLTIEQIEGSKSDEELFGLLGQELNRLTNNNTYATFDERLTVLRSLPIGLRSMAATYDLDVSITLDDLGWHFLNWYSLEFAEETLMGLKELGADAEAKIFSEAIEIAKQHWIFIGSPNFQDEYFDSPLDQALSPLNRLLWGMNSSEDPMAGTLLSYWVPYARKFPERIVPARELGA